MANPALLAPLSGLVTSTDPFLSPFVSFRDLENFHVRHGYLEKRSGYNLFGYMVHKPSTSITAITKANPGVVTAASHGLSNGQTVLITNVSGMTEVNNTLFTVAGVTTNTFQLSGVDTSSYTTYTSGGRVDLVPGLPIMGIYRYEAADGSQSVMSFDTKRAAIYDTSTNRFDPLDSADIMSSTNNDFVWAADWQPSGSANRLYFTNGLAYDGISKNGIRYYDPTVSTTATTLLNPSLGGTRTLYGAKLIFTLRQRILVLNTFEYDSSGGATTNYPNRMRWCQIQKPSVWNDVTPGQGGFLDAGTGEQIISARPLQEGIIVFFTNSVWTVRPVSDPALPFRWEKVNDFRACGGKMATCAYDRFVVSMGNRGAFVSDGTENRRIDDNNPDFTVDQINASEFKKVYCARDFQNERLWTLYPGESDVTSTRALIVEDGTNNWSTYQIGLNCLGYGNFSQDYALEDFTAANGLDFALNDMDEETLDSFFFQETSEAFLGGSTTGRIYTLNTETSDDGTSIDCNLLTNAWNPFQNEGKSARLLYVDIYADANATTKLSVSFYKDTENAPYKTVTTDLLPPLGYICLISSISQANPAVVGAPDHGLSTGDVIYIYGIAEGMTEVSGQYTITKIDANSFSLDGIDSTGFTAYTTGGYVCRRRFYRSRVVKRVRAGGVGFQHRMQITSSGTNAPLKISFLKPEFKPVGRRMTN